MSNASLYEINIKEFPHFQLYYDLWIDSLNKQADLIVLFYHWCFIHNRFRCIRNGKKSDYLPSEWNLTKDFYELYYVKHDTNYCVKVYIIEDNIHINLKRVNDNMETMQYFKINDYLNEFNQINVNYTESYKELSELYQRIKWSINAIKSSKRSKSEISSVCTISSVCSISSCSSDTATATIDFSSTNSERSYDGFKNKNSTSSIDLIKQIKQEKIDLDSELELLRHRSEILSINSMNNKKDKKETKEVQKPLKPADVFDHNPITYYYNYNNHLKSVPSISVDENNCLHDSYYNKLFNEYNLKFANLNVIDCLKTGLLKDMNVPIHLDKKMKKKLNLKPNREDRQSNKHNQNSTKLKNDTTNQTESAVITLEDDLDTSIHFETTLSPDIRENISNIKKDAETNKYFGIFNKLMQRQYMTYSKPETETELENLSKSVNSACESNVSVDEAQPNKRKRLNDIVNNISMNNSIL